MTRSSARSGLSMVDVTVALGVFAGLVLVVSSALVTGVEGGGSTWRSSVAMSVIRDRLAEIQETANTNMASVYTTYHGSWNGSGKTFDVAELPNGKLHIFCYKNETNKSAGTTVASGRTDKHTAPIPSELGGPRDLNMDGDAEDELGPTGDDAKLIPMTLTLTWTEKTSTQRLRVHALIGSTTVLK